MHVCGSNDLGDAPPTEESYLAYEQRFGHDYYSFWSHGTRGLVINTNLFKYPNSAPERAQAQLKWLKFELTNCKLKAHHSMVFGYHPWYLELPGEKENEWNLPLPIRKTLLKLALNNKVACVYAGHCRQTSTNFFTQRHLSRMPKESASEGVCLADTPDYPGQWHKGDTSSNGAAGSMLTGGSAPTDNDNNKTTIKALDSDGDEVEESEDDDEDFVDDVRLELRTTVSLGMPRGGEDQPTGLHIAKALEAEIENCFFQLSAFPQIISLPKPTHEGSANGGGGQTFG
jgi:hypothetical protein